MRVLVINGSPRENGCTARALKEVISILNAEGIETEVFNVGSKQISGCLSCNYCREKNECVIDDYVNELTKNFEEADGLLVGSPVYYAGCNGTVLSLLDRLFHSKRIDKTMKVGAAVLSSRRGGSTSAFDEINKYFTIANMPVVSSTYWNEVHGYEPSDVEKDLEGLQTMRNLGRSMAYLIKCIQLGKEKYGQCPVERGASTSFHDGK